MLYVYCKKYYVYVVSIYTNQIYEKKSLCCIRRQQYRCHLVLHNMCWNELKSANQPNKQTKENQHHLTAYAYSLG